MSVPDQDPGNSGNPFVFNPRFAGQYYDRETNLHYNGQRTYDPQLGIYTKPDPIGNVLYGAMAAQSLAARGPVNAGLAEQLYSENPIYNHSYAYVEGNPLSYTDPLGLTPGDKNFGITDKGFWKWWEQNKYDYGPFDKSHDGFNPKKPHDIPNKEIADLMKEEYEQCKTRDAGRGGKNRGNRSRGGRGGWGSQD